jgi:hypothetical protein
MNTDYITVTEDAQMQDMQAMTRQPEERTQTEQSFKSC